MSDANRPIASRFNVPDAFWHGLTLIGLEPAMVLRQARLPVTLGIRELRDRRQVSTQEFFRLWEAVHVLNPDPAAGILLVTRLDIAILPPSSFAAFIARDYRDGLHRLARFKQLCTPERLRVSEAGRHWPTFAGARSILVPGAMPWCSILPTWIDPSRAITRNCWRCSTRRSLQRWPRPRHLPAWPCK